MAQAPAAPDQQQLVNELKVSAHLMTLEPGIFCIFHAAGQKTDPATGLPGVRISVPPLQTGAANKLVHVLSFDEGGWIGGRDNAALIRVDGEQTQILITIYQRNGAAEPPPKIQIQQLSESAVTGQPRAAAEPAQVRPGATPTGMAEVSAHIQRRGDVVSSFGEWMGERGSQRWVEGYALSPQLEGLTKADIEYQAVLGRGWLSPWSEGGQYCGSRGMALPILGLRVRLKGDAAAHHTVRVRATFTDGSTAGPVDGSRTCEAESLAPLEAFQIELVPTGSAAKHAPPAEPGDRKPSRIAARTKPQVAAKGAPAPARARAPIKVAATVKPAPGRKR